MASLNPPGELTSWADIKKHYVKTPLFALDVFSAFPFEILAIFFPAHHDDQWRAYDYLRLNRIFKALQVLAYPDFRLC